MASRYAHGQAPVTRPSIQTSSQSVAAMMPRNIVYPPPKTSNSTATAPRKMGVYSLARGDDGQEVLILQSPSPPTTTTTTEQDSSRSRSWHDHLATAASAAHAHAHAVTNMAAADMSRESSMLSSLSSNGDSAGRRVIVDDDDDDDDDDEVDVEGVLDQEDHDEEEEEEEASFFEEYDGAPGLYGRSSVSTTVTAPPAPKRRQTTAGDWEDATAAAAAESPPVGAYPSHHLVATQQRAASFSFATESGGRRAWSPSVAAALYRPHDDYDEYESEYEQQRQAEVVELHPDAALLDAEIYGKGPAMRSYYDDVGHQVRSSVITSLPPERSADNVVAAAVSRFFPAQTTAESSPVHPYPTQQQQQQQPEHEAYYYDAYATAPAEDPYQQPAAPLERVSSPDAAAAAAAAAAPLPPSPLSESGVHLSAWLAECVWSLLIHPYRPEKFGEADLRLEEQLREQEARQLAYGGYTDGWYDESRYSTRTSFQSTSSSSSPVTPSPCNLYYNPYGLRSKPSQAFVDFVHRTLSQTLLSSTAVVLSLWYIRRFAVHAEGGGDGRLLRKSLFDAASDPQGRGSEEVARRVLVLGLACSNKWLDDNTFTNKSWSDVTHLPLVQINRLEMLALGPISFDLSVDTPLWTKWLCEIHSHVSPFVTDSRLVQESIRQMFLALDDFEHRYDAEVVMPRERSRWGEAETDRWMAPRLHQLAFAHSPMFVPQQPPTTPSHLALDGFAAHHHHAQQQQVLSHDPFISDPAAIRRPSHPEWHPTYGQWSSPVPHPHMLSQQKERQHSAYSQALQSFWSNYTVGAEDQQQPQTYGAYALPPLRNLAVMA